MTSLYKTAFVGQLLALELVLAVLLLPNAGFYFLLLSAILVFWFPVAKLTADVVGQPLRALLLLFVCILLLLSEDFELLVRSHDANEWIIILPMTWLICLLCIPDSLEMNYPLGFLSCISLATVRLPSTSFHLGLLLAVVALLIASGALLFLTHLRHPSSGASRMGRTSAFHYSSHLLVLLFATSLMLISADWVRRHAGHLKYLFPDLEDSGGNNFALESDAPRFKDKTICSLASVRGPLPLYLAERYFLRYEKGQWLGARSCFLAGNEYGTNRETVFSGRAQNMCLVSMARQDQAPLIPYGAVRSDAVRVERWLREGPSDRTPQVTDFEWRIPPFPQPYTKPMAEALTLPDLSALRQKAQTLCTDVESATDKVAILSDYLRSQHFYDMKSAFRADNRMDPAEFFLFKAKRGWCVHFASAATLMLRAVGVPARFVVGYLANSSGATATVTDRMGHAWCEAYVGGSNGYSWVIVDPSAVPSGPQYLSAQYVKTVLGLFLLAILAVFVIRTLARTITTDLRQEMQNDGARSEAERIAATYHRILRYLERIGVYRRKSETPREFVTQSAPSRFRNDLGTVTDAFEKVRYMGYTELGALTPKVEEAQRRMLGVKRSPRPRATGASSTDGGSTATDPDAAG